MKKKAKKKRESVTKRIKKKKNTKVKNEQSKQKIHINKHI